MPPDLPACVPAEPAESFADSIERVVRQRTSGMIRGLHVEVYNREVLLTGRTTTYYAKQLATHAALEACEQFSLVNDIEVS